MILPKLIWNSLNNLIVQYNITKIQKNSLHFKFHNLTNDSLFSSLRIHNGSNMYDGFKIM